MLVSLKAKKGYLDISTEEIFLGNDHYFIKSSQATRAIISRIEDKISKWNLLLKNPIEKAQNGCENAVIQDKGEL